MKKSVIISATMLGVFILFSFSSPTGNQENIGASKMHYYSINATTNQLPEKCKLRVTECKKPFKELVIKVVDFVVKRLVGDTKDEVPGLDSQSYKLSKL